MCADFSELASVFRGRDRLARRVAAILGGSVAAVAVVLAVPQVRAQIVTNLLNPQRQNAAQFDMAVAIDRMCTNPSFRDITDPETEELNDTCDAVAFELPNDEQRDGVLQSLNGEEVQAIQQQVGDVQATQVANISARMEAIRAGLAAPGLSFAGLTFDDDWILPAGYEDFVASSEGGSPVGEGGTLSAPFWDKVGVFTTLGGSFGDKSETGKVTGYDFYTVGLTTGADYRIRDDLALGAAVGYSYYNVDFDKNQDNPSDQNLDSNNVIFSFFGTYFPNRDSLVPLEGLFLDGLASFGWSFFDMSRHIIVPSPAEPSLDEKADSDTTAFQYWFAGNLGYEFNVQRFTITPVARVQYIKADVGSYEESGAGPVNLKVGSQDVTSLTTNLGASLGYAFSTRYGVLEPSVRAEYAHEFENNDDGASIRYASDPTGLSTFNVTTEGPNRNYGIVGAALTGTLAGGWSAFADFETVVGFGKFDIYAFRAGFRKEF